MHRLRCSGIFFYYNYINICTKIYHPNFENNLCKKKEISGNRCQNSAVNYHIKSVTPDHKIAIKISYLIEFYFSFLLFLHSLYMFVNKKNTNMTLIYEKSKE